MADATPVLGPLIQRGIAQQASLLPTVQQPVQSSGPVQANLTNGSQNIRIGQGGVGAVNLSNDVIDTDTSVPGLIAEAFEPQVKQAQQQQFLKGAMEALHGASVNQVRDEQPWVSKLFGPSQAEQGAAFYTAQDKLATWESQFQADIGNLQTKTPEEVQDYLSKGLGDMLTGNAPTDILIQQNGLQRSLAMFQTYTKANLAYKQQQAVIAQTQAITQAGSVYQQNAVSAAKIGGKAPNDDPSSQLGAAKLSFAQLLQKPDNQTEESYQAMLQQVARSQIQQGNWYTYKLMQDSGVLNRLPIEKLTALDTYADRQHNMAKQKASLDYATTLGAMTAQAHTGQVSPEMVVAQRIAFNKRYTADTGDDRGYFDAEDISKDVASSAEALFQAQQRQLEHVQRLQEAAYTEQLRTAAKLQSDTLNIQLAAGGNIGATLVPAGEQQAALTTLMAASANKSPGNPVQGIVDHFMPIASRNYLSTNLVSQSYKDSLSAQVDVATDGSYGEGPAKVYQQWQAMYQQPGGPAMVKAYFGDDTAKKLARFNQLVVAHVDPSNAWDTTMKKGTNPAWPAGMDKQAAQSAIADVLSTNIPKAHWWWPFGGVEQPNPSSQTLINNAMQAHFIDLKAGDPTLTDTAAAANAFKVAQSQGLQMYGKYALQAPRGQTPLWQQANIPQDTFSRLFSATVDAKLQKRGLKNSDDNSYHFVVSSQNGQPTVLVYALNADGDPFQATFSLKDILDKRQQEVQDSLGKKSNVPDHSSDVHLTGAAL